MRITALTQSVMSDDNDLEFSSLSHKSFTDMNSGSSALSDTFHNTGNGKNTNYLNYKAVLNELKFRQKNASLELSEGKSISTKDITHSDKLRYRHKLNQAKRPVKRQVNNNNGSESRYLKIGCHSPSELIVKRNNKLAATNTNPVRINKHKRNWCLQTIPQVSVIHDERDIHTDSELYEEMSVSRKRYPRRAEPIRHASIHADNSDVLENTTSFVFRNGRWIHEPRNPHHTIKRASSVQPTDQRKKDNFAGNSYGTKLHSPAEKASSVDTSFLNSLPKPTKPKSLLGFAKKKWTDLTDLVKDQKKPLPVLTRSQVNDRAPALPPKRIKQNQTEHPHRRSFSPLFGTPSVPKRRSHPPPSLPPRNSELSYHSRDLPSPPTSLDLTYENNSRIDVSPTRPSRPRHDKTKQNAQVNLEARAAQSTTTVTTNKTSGKQNSISTSSNPKPDRDNVNYINDALYKFDELLANFKHRDVSKTEQPYESPISLQVNSDTSNKNGKTSDNSHVSTTSQSIHDRKSGSVKEWKSVMDRMKEYAQKVSGDNNENVDTNYQSMRLCNNSNIKRVENSRRDMDIKRSDTTDECNNASPISPQAKLSPYLYAEPACYDDKVTCLNTPGGDLNSLVNNSVKGGAYKERDTKSPVLYTQDIDNDIQASPVHSRKNTLPGNVPVMADQTCTSAGDNNVELKIREENCQDGTDGAEIVRVKRHRGFKTRRVLSTRRNGEYEETRQESLEHSQTREIKRCHENGKTEIQSEKKATSQERSISVVVDPIKVVESLAKNCKQTLAETEKTLVDGNKTSTTKRAVAVGSIDVKVNGADDTLQLTRIISGDKAVLETQRENNKGMVLRQAIIKIPNAGIVRSGNSPLQSPSGSESSQTSASTSMRRYRVISSSEISESVDRSIEEISKPPVSDISETDKKVILAAIEGRLKEKEAKLNNEETDSGKHTTDALKPQRADEEETLARSKILAQANERMKGRVPLRKRNILVDEEMLETLFLRCIICQEKYNTDDRIPKLLPCHHTYCLHCLQEMFRVEAEHRQSLTTAFQERPSFVSINCPTCRESHMINDKNYSQLKSDQKIQKLLEISNLPVTEFVGYCQTHRTQLLDYFCETCGRSICNDCRVLDHNRVYGHDVYQRDDILKRCSDNIEDLCAAADEKDEALHIIETRLQATVDAVEKRLSETVGNIKDVFDKFRISIDNRQGVLMEKCCREIDRKTDDYSADLEAITQRLESLVQTKDCLTRAKQNEDIEQMFVNQKNANDMFSSPLDLISKPANVVKPNFNYDKRNRANIMSTISDHGILISQN